MGMATILDAKGVYIRMIIKVNGRVLFRHAPDDYVTFELSPTTSVKNNQAYVLAKVIADWYRKPSELRSWGNGAALTLSEQQRVNFRVVLKPKEIRFYMLVPRERAGEILRKAEAVYHENISINEVEPLQGLNPKLTVCSELSYRKHDIFSLATDKDNNYPLPSLLTAVRTLEGDDVAVFDTLLEPYDRCVWLKEAKKAVTQLEKGYVPNSKVSNKVLQLVHEFFNSLRFGLLEIGAITREQKLRLKKWRREDTQYLEAALMLKDMSTASKKKQADEVVRAWVRVAAQSENKDRARSAVRTMANAWKDISLDNDLEITEIPDKWTPRYLTAIERRKPLSIRMRPVKLGTDEAGKFLQLPGRTLIEEFPEIQARKLREVQVSQELTQEKGIRIGWVTERGARKLIRIPTNAFGDIKLAAVYDALCTASFGQGKQGSGKTDGFGTTWAYDMVLAGFTVIIMDTADGQVLRNFVNCLPEDYPEEKLHLLNYDNKAWPIPLGWDDIYGREFGAIGDEELAAMEIQERVTSRLISFIGNLSATGEFTDRMKQYVVSCMRAITRRKTWDFSDLELALTSPAYRVELLQLPEVQSMSDVVRDLNALQHKAADGKEGQVIEFILNRIRVLSGTQFLANVFFQPPKRREDGKPLLDIRRIMDNPEGGYGHVVCVQASGDAWQGLQPTILGFMLDKINFNAFSRTDTEQKDRKPCMVWIDEPHKIIGAIQADLSGTAVEFRKYRVKNLFTGHSIEQMGKAANALLDGGAQVTSYKTERLEELKRFAHAFKPYDDAAELYDALPEKWRAINAVRLPSGKTCPAFIADMVPPPAAIKDRGYCWQQSAEKYGRPWKEVRDAIQVKRAHYQTLDMEWLEEQNEERAAAKQAEREAKKAERETAKGKKAV